MTIVPIYAALLALGYIYLATRVIAVRRSRKVALGTQGDPALERAVRVHGNFAEYAPITLLLLLMMELKGANFLWLNLLCLSLLVGRASHAFGFSNEDEDFRFRIAGMMLTFGALASAALSLLFMSIIMRA